MYWSKLIYIFSSSSRDLSQAEQIKKKNYFDSKRPLLTFLSENNGRFVNLLRFGNGYFLLSFR